MKILPALVCSLGAALLCPVSSPAQSLAQVETQLIAEPSAAGDLFGGAAALSGDTAVIGAPGNDGSVPQNGAAFVYRRSAGVWRLEQMLTALDGAANDSFGWSVAISEDTILIGAYRDDDQGSSSGSAYVFTRSGTTWVQEAKLLASDGQLLDWFGRAVALEGDRALIGAPRDDDLGNLSGSVYAFSRAGGLWAEDAKLNASDGQIRAQFGLAVAVRDGLAVIGAPDDEVGFLPPGSAYAFRWDGAAWSEEAKLVASNPVAYDKFGDAVAVSGDVIAIGAPGVDFPASGAAGVGRGAAYVFEYSGGSWSEVALFSQPDPNSGFYYGEALALEGETLLVGAPGAKVSGVRAGRVLLYRRTAGQWIPLSSVVEDDFGAVHRFGSAVALGVEGFVVGAEWYLNAGRAYGYSLEQAATATPYCTAGTSASGCQAVLQASGQPSATASSGFFLSAAGIEGSVDGLFFFGVHGRQASAWGNGTSLMCVAPPRSRGRLLVALGTSAGSCDGALVEDLNSYWCPGCSAASLNPGAGTVVDAQLWYRDPNNTSNQSSSLSNAVEFRLLP